MCEVIVCERWYVTDKGKFVVGGGGRTEEEEKEEEEARDTESKTRTPHKVVGKKHSSDHLSVHQWICSAIRDLQQPLSPIGFLFLKLPPPPCAVLLVSKEV